VSPVQFWASALKIHSAEGGQMVTRKTLEKYMNDADAIAEEIHEKPEVVVKVLKQVEVRIENGRRQPKPPAPEGGISLSSAERKYKVPNPTISRWVKKGYIPILLRTKKELYIHEKILADVIKQYLVNPGQGKRTIKNIGGN